MTFERLKKHWPKWLALAAVLLVAAAGVFLLMLLHKPGDYRPETLTPEQAEQTEDYAIAQTQYVYNSANALKPFSVTFEQFQLNRLLSLAQQEAIEKKLASAMDRFQNPQVRITSDGVYLMGCVNYKNMNLILTIGFRFRLIEAGEVELELLPVEAGLVTIPEKIVRRYFTDALSILQQARQGANAPSTAGKDEIFIDIKPTLISSIEKLSQNEQVILPAKFKVDDDKLVRITGIHMEQGSITLDMKPIILE